MLSHKESDKNLGASESDYMNVVLIPAFVNGSSVKPSYLVSAFLYLFVGGEKKCVFPSGEKMHAYSGEATRETFFL